MDKTTEKLSFRELIKIVGPSLLLTATTVGPGSLIATTRIGSQYGYSLLWWLATMIIIQALYLIASYRYTLISGKNLITGIGETYGWGWAIAAAIGVMAGQATFSISNFVGTGLGINILFPFIPLKAGSVFMLICVLVLIFTKGGFFNKILIIAKTCIFVVTLMYLVTVVLLGGPNPVELFSGLIPRIPATPGGGSAATIMLSLMGTTAPLGMVAYTTFALQENNTTFSDLERGKVKWDIIVRSIALFLLTGLLMVVGAIVLRPQGIVVANASDLVAILIPVIGKTAAVYVMGIGFFACTITPFFYAPQVGTSMVLAAFRKSSGSDKKLSKIINAAVLIFAGTIGLLLNRPPVQLMIIAQIGTTLASPMLAVFIFLLSNRAEMGKYKSGKVFNVFLLICLVITIFALINGLYSLFGAR